jgi:hypothetical protein
MPAAVILPTAASASITGWRTSSTCHGTWLPSFQRWGTEALLRSYSTERRPAVWQEAGVFHNPARVAQREPVVIGDDIGGCNSSNVHVTNRYQELVKQLALHREIKQHNSYASARKAYQQPERRVTDFPLQSRACPDARHDFWPQRPDDFRLEQTSHNDALHHSATAPTLHDHGDEMPFWL